MTNRDYILKFNEEMKVDAAKNKRCYPDDVLRLIFTIEAILEEYAKDNLDEFLNTEKIK